MSATLAASRRQPVAAIVAQASGAKHTAAIALISHSSEACRTLEPTCLAHRFQVAWRIADDSTSARTSSGMRAARSVVEREREHRPPAERRAERPADEQQDEQQAGRG